MNLTTKNSLFAAAAFAMSGTLVSAASIGVKFIDTDDVAFGAAVAGAPGYAQANWNFMLTDWSGNVDNDTALANLQDSTGAPASQFQNVDYPPNSDPVHYDAANTWRSGAGNGTANDTLMNGYLDDGNDDQPFVNISLANSVTSATVVLYFHGDVAAGAVGRYWLEEWTDPLVAGTVITDQVGILANDWDGTFNSAGTFGQTAAPGNVDVTANSNYIVFENITANNIRIRSAGNADPEDFGRGPLNAFQVITIPEPSGALLFGLAGAVLALRRRK